MPRCNAKSKRSGERCKRNCSPGKTVCHYHGGRTPRGFKLPQTRHGFYSKNLPPHLRETYEESLADQRGLDLRQSIAVVNARIATLFQEFALVYENDRMDKARVQINRMKIAMTDGDRANLRSGMIELDRLIRFGAREYHLWDQIMVAFELLRKLKMSYLKWQIASGQLIPIDQAITLFKAVGFILKENVADPKVREKICNRIKAMMEEETKNLEPEYSPPNIGKSLNDAFRKGLETKEQPYA
jgi:hypothetical protein